MYTVGDYIVKKGNGVCKVENIMHLDMNGIDKNKSLLRIIKTTYLRKQDRLEQGKKSTAVDEYYLTLAEKLFFSELCFVLKKDKEEIHNLIAEAVNKH